MSFSYQRSTAQNLVSSEFTLNTAPLPERSLNFDFAYALNDHWTVSAGLPWITRKALGPSHNPLALNPPHPESKFIDDGQYHGYFQDLRLGARYLVFTEPFILEPYITVSTPASDYPFFAIAAVGQHLRRTELGSAFSYRPPFLKWFFNLEAGYVYAPKVLGYDIGAVRVEGEAVYFLNPRTSLKTFFSSKNGKGIDPPRTPTSVPSEIWYEHDRLIRHNYATLGLGVDLAMKDRNTLGISWIEMVHTEDIFKLKQAIDITLSRSFGSATPAARHGLPRSRPRINAD